VAPEHHRIIATVLSTLANTRSQLFNVLQGRLGYYLYSNGVSKRVISLFNKLNLCPSYNGLLHAIKSSGGRTREKLAGLGRAGRPIQISYDNCTFTSSKRDLRINNYAGHHSYVAGYVVQSAEEKSYPLFTKDDVNRDGIRDVRLADILPKADSGIATLEATRYMVSTSLISFAKDKGRTIARLDFEFPSRRRLNQLVRPTIMTLPTYPFDESVTNQLIECIYRIADDVGLTREQRVDGKVHFKGDLGTVDQNRYLT
jgi:hypothetical protein